MRFVEVRRCHFQRAGLEDLVEIYAATPPLGGREARRCVSLVVTRLSFRRPGVRLIIREPSPLVEGKHVEKQILPKEIVVIIFLI